MVLFTFMTRVSGAVWQEPVVPDTEIVPVKLPLKVTVIKLVPCPLTTVAPAGTDQVKFETLLLAGTE